MDGRGSCAWRSSTATALSAAAAASGPWPSASTTATSVPVGKAFTTARSPVLVWPGNAREATAQSRSCVSIWTLTNPSPLLHGHGRALAGSGLHVELVHQPAGAREPQ